jgi:hypothetical protein
MTDKPSKKWIRDYDYAMFEVDYDQTLNEYMDYIKELINEGWEGIELRPQGYDHGLYPFLYKTRMETDVEFQVRLELAEKEQKKKAKAEERKRRQYEKLKKEFEPNGISN